MRECVVSIHLSWSGIDCRCMSLCILPQDSTDAGGHLRPPAGGSATGGPRGSCGLSGQELSHSTSPSGTYIGT